MKLSKWLFVTLVISIAFGAAGLFSAVLAEAKVAKKAKNRPEILQDVINLEKDGNIMLAVEGYNKIIARFPATKEAKIAEDRLNKIEKIIREKCNFQSDAVMYSINGIREEKSNKEIVDYVITIANKYPSVSKEFKNGRKYDKNYGNEYYEYYIEPLAQAIYNEVKTTDIDNKQYDNIRSLIFNDCSEKERNKTPAPAPGPEPTENE